MRLISITEDNWMEVASLSVKEEQKKYVVSAQQLPFFRKNRVQILNPQGITPLRRSLIPVPQLQV